MQQDYVVGFLFSRDKQKVALIKKTKPAWMSGKLNGVGGKIEPGETPHAAMVREFREETGAEVVNWDEYFTLSGFDYKIWFFRAYGDVLLLSTTDEEVLWVSLSDIAMKTSIPLLFNLSWLIPLALDPNHPIGVAENFCSVSA